MIHAASENVHPSSCTVAKLRIHNVGHRSSVDIASKSEASTVPYYRRVAKANLPVFKREAALGRLPATHHLANHPEQAGLKET